MDPSHFFPASFPTIPTTASAGVSATASVLEAQNHIAQPNFIDQSFVTAGLSHPSYDEMIYTAITALKEGNGSSKKAIAKYIERVYSDLPSTHSVLLAHHLKRLKDSGHIVMVKNTYKLPGSETPPAAPTPTAQPGRRGRPPKLKPIPSTQPVLVSLGLVDEASPSESEKRGPGRPPKSGPPPAEQGETVLGKRGRGRPPGSKNKVGPKGTKRGPGRPPKDPHLVVIPYASDVIPYASDVIPSTTVGTEIVPKRRGRPKKVASAAAAASASPTSGANDDGVTVYSGVVKRSVGRPRKNPPVAGNGTQAHDSVDVAYGELKRKFDYFQAKVKDAVEVIKPYLSNETAFPVLTAIQELDVLASMDVTGPWKDQTQMNL